MTAAASYTARLINVADLAGPFQLTRQTIRDYVTLLERLFLRGLLLETFVLQELRRQASWNVAPISFFHFRDRDGVEVDIVLEQGVGAVVGIEVKASATVAAADFRGLCNLKEAVGAQFKKGVVLYDGEVCASFGDGLYAVPLRALWEMS